MYPEHPEFPYDDLPGGGRLYRLRGDVRVLAVWHPGPLPGARRGAMLYGFFEGEVAGRWDWCRDSAALLRILHAYQQATDPEYVPPDWQAPGGERAMLRPPMRNLLATAIEEGRPGPQRVERGHVILAELDW